MQENKKEIPKKTLLKCFFSFHEYKYSHDFNNNPSINVFKCKHCGKVATLL